MVGDHGKQVYSIRFMVKNALPIQLAFSKFAEHSDRHWPLFQTLYVNLCYDLLIFLRYFPILVTRTFKLDSAIGGQVVVIVAGANLMELSSRQGLGGVHSFAIVKSFSVWAFTLTVCWLVVGFPLVVLMATMGVLATVILQAVLPISAVLLVTGSLFGGNILLVLIGAAILTAKGIHPQDVRWLSWLHGESTPSHSSVYASCPLTCGLIP